MTFGFRKTLVACFFLALLGCAAPRRARAQFIGYVSPQTVQQTLATNTPCTGSAQTFSITNLGQVQHSVSIASVTGATNFIAELDGIDNQGNVYRLSDIAELATLGSQPVGTLYGSGYFPKLRISVTCSPATTATFTASYSGGWGSSTPLSGSYLNASVDKVNFNAADATVAQTDDARQTPYNSSNGTLIVSLSAITSAGGSVRVRCGTNAFNAVMNVGLFQLATTAGPQLFPLRARPCPYISVDYTPGTVGAGTLITSEINFNVPAQEADNDPCQSKAIPKSSVPISASAASTTQLVAGVTNANIHACGFSLSLAAAGTFQFITGTGSTCGTSSSNLTGAYSAASSTPFTFGPGSEIFPSMPQGQGVCLTLTGSGASAAGVFLYIQD